MLRIEIAAAGRMKAGAARDLYQEYEKRMPWPVTLHEIEGRNTADEHKRLEARINSRAYVFVLDEKGKSLRSAEFASKMSDLSAQGRTEVQFLIGGADGLTDAIRKKADFLLSFGNQTWPHMLARVMLIEQVYRATQILAGHPYHRE